MKLKFLKNSIVKNIEVQNKIINLHNEIKTASIKILNTLKKKKKILIKRKTRLKSLNMV